MAELVVGRGAANSAKSLATLETGPRVGWGCNLAQLDETLKLVSHPGLEWIREEKADRDAPAGHALPLLPPSPFQTAHRMRFQSSHSKIPVLGTARSHPPNSLSQKFGVDFRARSGVNGCKASIRFARGSAPARDFFPITYGGKAQGGALRA